MYPEHSQAIKEQLGNMINDRLFNASPRLKKYLCYLVNQTLAGNTHQLKAYTIGTEFFERGADFDPLHDPVVRMETAKLRNRLMEYYFSAPSPGKVRIDIPKGGYLPTFAWFDGPGRSSEKTEEMPGREDIKDACGDSGGKASSPGPQISIAALPFINLSPDQLSGSFIEGLANEIIVGLTRFDELSVASSCTVRNINRTQNPTFKLPEQLGVRFILHGSAQRHNDLIRVTAELADMESGSNIWAERVESRINDEDFLSVQDEIAHRLVSRIGDSFGSIRRKLRHEVGAKEPEDLEFYELMLSYHQWVPTFDPDLFMQARQALELLYEREPNNAVVAASLADLYGSDYQMAYDTVTDAIKKCQEFALHAIALDGSSQTAYWALALHFFLQRNEAQFKQAIAKVIPLNPANSHMMMATGFLVGLSGDLDEGLDLMDRALQLNPAAPCWYRIVPYFKHYLEGNYEAALNMALFLNTPSCFWDPMLRAAAYGQLGKRTEGDRALYDLHEILPDFSARPMRYIHGIALKVDTANHIKEGLIKAGLCEGG